MLTKKTSEHISVYTPTCGTFKEILQKGEYDAFDLAFTVDLESTQAHFHTLFDEIYYVLDGWLELDLYDPKTRISWAEKLHANELCIVDKNIHHRVTKASKRNRLCVICVPGFDERDEYLSEILG